MRKEQSNSGTLGHSWLQALQVLLVGSALVATPREVVAELCVNAQVAEVCMEPEAVANLVDPEALRRMFVAKAPAFRQSNLENKRAIEHPEASALAQKWNTVAASVLQPPRERGDFYRSVFELGELQVINMQLDARPILRISGLPHTPQTSFDAVGLSDLFQALGIGAPPQGEVEKVAAELIASLQREGVGALLGQAYNMVPLFVEFMYQLRLIHRAPDKQVVVFEDKADGSSPFVDPVGTLYVPASFFGKFDPTEQELTLIHEATHLAQPGSKWLMQLLMNRLNAMGPMSQVMGSPAFKERLRRTDMDMEWNIDISVLSYLRSRGEMRRRYQLLIERFEPGSVRVGIIDFFNRRIEAGEWPRPPVRLHLRDLTPAFIAMARVESLPDRPEKLEAMKGVLDSILTVLPQGEQAFYAPLYQLMFRQFAERPKEVIIRTGLRYTPSQQVLLEEGVSQVFKEVLDKWEHR